MIYIKTYCYSEHEFEFIKAQLIESEGYVDKIILYEYNVTHRGEDKPYRMAHLIESLEPRYASRLIYRPVDIKHLSKCGKDFHTVHCINEPIQRSYMFNDSSIRLESDDIIFDVDVDEIIYKKCYIYLIFMAKYLFWPIGIKLNQFFYRKNYLWTNANFRSPTVYKYSVVSRNVKELFNGFVIAHRRDINFFLPWPCGAHLSWIMPVEMMIRKLKSYSHPEYEIYADQIILEEAILNKKYIFDRTRKFNILELDFDDIRIPEYFREN